MKKTEAKQEVARLVSKLDSLTEREFKKYDEANTKKDFIEPLFSALGWATKDRREVTAEDKVSRRRVDYAFRIEGIPKFFLEAKPLKADLDNPEYAWQAINYAWTKGVTWAALTDFEGLKVFNAQWKGPSLLYNHFLDIPYTEYLERFDELWLLSRRSFEKGLLDIEAEKVAKKAKREPVGKELFDDLIVWRQRLYGQLRGWKENKRYSAAQIDEAVQRILDRFIFIRTAEDRELEERVLLPAVREWRENGRRKELDNALVRIFRQFDEKYDSELFEVGHFCEDLVCDSTTYAWVIEGLYGMRDEVPTYNFDAIDVDVLGGIYEQYLSYRQGLPEEVEEAKRARRKKRGIYYTPKFVVQYIVENTVGRLLQERSHDEIRKVRILDPACGSGSFLIEAFEMLARYHQEVTGGVGEALVASRKREGTSPSPTDREYDDFLERLRILRDNIYGVDLDPQAVEIARLNLLLKTLYQRALLPKLEDNIRCGNSLISGMPIELSQYFGADWEAKRPFNWEEEFPKIMEEGGFDVVIGNPPWVFTRDVDFGESTKRYFSDHYVGATGKVNSYALFVLRGVNLLRPGGLFSMIIPNTFLRATTYEDVRRNLLEQYCVLEITDVGSDVFPGVTASTVILVIKKDNQAPETRINTLEKTGKATLVNIVNARRVLKNPSAVISIYADDTFNQIADKVASFCQPLSAYIEHLISGIQTWKQHKSNFIANRQLNADYKPLLEGRDIGRYKLHFAGKYILYDRKVLNVMQDENIFLLKEKILIQRVGGGPQPIRATLDTDSFYTFNSINTLVCRGLDNRYILGCLNSKFMNWFYYNKFSNRSSLTVNISARLLKQLPIRHIDFDNPQDVKMHDDLVALVERMLDLHKRLKDAKGEEKKELERQIARTDRRIDDLVYQLYDITEEDRKVIEEM